MRVIAARFLEAQAASQAASEIRSRLELGPKDVDIAPLGTADPAQEGSVLLAGRFPASKVDEIRRIIEGAGGEIVADLDEGRTRPRRLFGPQQMAFPFTRPQTVTIPPFGRHPTVSTRWGERRAILTA